LPHLDALFASERARWQRLTPRRISPRITRIARFSRVAARAIMGIAARFARISACARIASRGVAARAAISINALATSWRGGLAG